MQQADAESNSNEVYWASVMALPFVKKRGAHIKSYWKPSESDGANKYIAGEIAAIDLLEQIKKTRECRDLISRISEAMLLGDGVPAEHFSEHLGFMRVIERCVVYAVRDFDLKKWRGNIEDRRRQLEVWSEDNRARMKAKAAERARYARTFRKPKKLNKAA